MSGSHLLSAFLLVLPFFHARAQSIQPLPSDSIHAMVILGQANEVIIEFANPGPDSLHLRWKLLESDMEAGWDIDLCDHGNCYTGIPSTAVMAPAPPGTNPYLKLIVQPGATPGVAMLSFRVYLVQDLNQAQTVKFQLSAFSTTMTSQAAPAALKVFPNPVIDQLFLHYQGEAPLPWVRVIGSDGYQVGPLYPVIRGLRSIDVSSWPLGTHYIAMPNGSIIPIVRQ